MSLKHQLHARCLEQIHERIHAAQEAITQAQQSANEETKSSAGDKYETGRAMAQLEIEKISTQLTDAMKLKQSLVLLSTEKVSSTVSVGSLVITDQGNFYIAVSVGQFELDSKLYYVISPVAPIAKQMLGLKLHTSFSFQGKNFTIREIL